MFYDGKSAFVGILWLIVHLWLLFNNVSSNKVCELTKCKGPVQHYRELNCTPVYEKQGDCCAIRYNCPDLSGRSPDKCYVNGHEYNIGEKLKNEDSFNPCNIGCTCGRGYTDMIEFTCSVVDCFHQPIKEGCYFKRKPNSCCGGEEICPKNPNETIKCEVDGTIYSSGEFFHPKENPLLECQCTEGYKGKNIQQYCKQYSCETELRHAWEIRKNCIPVFYSGQGPQINCPISYRCQNKNDIVLRSSAKTSAKEDMMCKFGNLTLHIGDELNQATNYDSVCVKCKCEVPPTPSCQQLPHYKCDMSIHPLF